MCHIGIELLILHAGSNNRTQSGDCPMHRGKIPEILCLKEPFRLPPEDTLGSNLFLTIFPLWMRVRIRTFQRITARMRDGTIPFSAEASQSVDSHPHPRSSCLSQGRLVRVPSLRGRRRYGDNHPPLRTVRTYHIFVANDTQGEPSGYLHPRVPRLDPKAFAVHPASEI